MILKMPAEILVYIVTLMVLYDWSIHLIYLFRKEDWFFKHKLRYWPNFGKGKKFNRRFYDVVWTMYWFIAFLLLISYILFH